MKRLLDGDVNETRNKYLGHFARHFHFTPSEVDALRFYDFIRLVLYIDSMHAAMDKGSD